MCFLFCNALIALSTVLFTSTQVWVIYNGFISYVLMGILFLGEFILRKRHQRLHSSNH
ncbi:putative membrane protein [Acinetobacter baumannii 1457504]|nr:putative membrane protein [Acinetobacter baumannii 1457504]